ncbi:MAG: GNAT family N-acetyltransferase [Candidatus Eremiobacteraeota bacterium]|nr:GNAT family N-acetyltransferase [Candidatus Eremiobacteraeota bacterium]MCW5869584.1 GNAT family N-acetyltransferase [Candidatus Eremiobacteraeota bacterium]
MRQITFADLDLPQQTEALNLVYRGYDQPFQVSQEWVAEHLQAHSIEAGRSPLWLDGRNQVAALSLLALRNGYGWIGGFGVAPVYRGNRFSGPVLRETLKDLDEAPVQLEVLVTNLKARATYERGGFRVTRQLVVLEGPPGPAGQTLEPAGSPCWQRQPASLERLQDLVWVEQSLAYRGHQLHFVGEGASWGELASQPRLRLSNEPAGSPLHRQLLALGWREVARQYEMHRPARSPAENPQFRRGQAAPPLDMV